MGHLDEIQTALTSLKKSEKIEFFLGLFLVIDMQTLPLSKVAIVCFWLKKMRNVLKPMITRFSNFLFLRYGRFCTQNT